MGKEGRTLLVRGVTWTVGSSCLLITLGITGHVCAGSRSWTPSVTQLRDLDILTFRGQFCHVLHFLTDGEYDATKIKNFTHYACTSHRVMRSRPPFGLYWPHKAAFCCSFKEMRQSPSETTGNMQKHLYVVWPSSIELLTCLRTTNNNGLWERQNKMEQIIQ